MVNRPDFPGGSNMREDGAYGNSEAVFNGSTGAGCTAGAGAAGRAWLAVGKHLVDLSQDRLRSPVSASIRLPRATSGLVL